MTIPQRPLAVLRRQLVIIFGAGLVLAALCNGAATYLKRIGLLDHASYQAYWLAHCENNEKFAAPLGRGTLTATCPCDEGRAPVERTPEQLRFESAQSRYLYDAEGFGIALKLVKDALAVGFVLLSLHLAWTQQARLPAAQSCWPMIFMAAVVLFGFANSWANHGSALALAGLRPFLYLAIALAGSWAAVDLAIFARCIALLMGIELLLMPLEFAFGMHIHGHFGDTSVVRRLSGTLVAPNTFGIFAVAGLAFHHAYSSDRRYLVPLASIAAVLVAASGSATAFIVLLLFVFAISTAKFAAGHPVVVCLSAIALGTLVLIALPTLVGRTDVFDSVFGAGARLDEITLAIRASKGLDFIAGNGLGLGTNAEVNLLKGGGPAFLVPSPAGAPIAAESGVVALFRQSGLAGLLAFYSMLAWASWKDRRARLFYLVIAVCSLTAKIDELFPVNFLLGLALAHSILCASLSPRPRAADDRPQDDRRQPAPVHREKNGVAVRMP